MPGWLTILIAILVVLGILFLGTILFNVDFKGGDGGKHYTAVSQLLR